MDESLMVLVRLPREDASATSDKTGGNENTADGHVMESPGRTSHDGDASDDHVEEDSAGGRMKKRKSTYKARREEMAELAVEVVSLREQLQELKAQQLRFQPITTEEKNQTAALRWQVTRSRLVIASAQSLVSSYNVQYEKPLIGDYIHLPHDPVQRQQILEGLKAHKMDEALAFLAARCQHVDLRRHARQIDSFEASNGDLVGTYWAVTKISEGQPTVRRVYDEMLEFARISEMAIAEKSGLVGVRESDAWLETIDATQVRLLTSHPPNLLVERNYAIYTQYFPRSHALDQPHGLLVCDYVDQDDAHPYKPHERIRADESSVTMVVECPRTKPDEPRSVAVVNWGFKRTHHSHLATEDELHRIVREGPRAYYDVMVRTIREKLASEV